MHIAIKGLCIAATIALSGCGNAYEHISVGEWEDLDKGLSGGPAVMPEYTVDTTQAGSGRAVRYGELVKVRLQVVRLEESGPSQEASL
jgi:hypothetical protein